MNVNEFNKRLNESVNTALVGRLKKAIAKDVEDQVDTDDISGVKIKKFLK